MTPEQRAVVIAQVGSPGEPVMTRESRQRALLDAFHTDDGKHLGTGLLHQAELDRSASDVELALIVADVFGMDESLLPVLKRLAHEPWHARHQDVCRSLVEAGGRDDVVDDLEFMASAGPEYQNYRGDTALARQAVH